MMVILKQLVLGIILFWNKMLGKKEFQQTEFGILFEIVFKS